MKKKIVLKKVVAKKAKSATPHGPPSFEDLAHAAAVSDFKRLQSMIVHEIKTVKKPTTIKCPKCKTKHERTDLTSYICPNCPGTAYFDESSGLEIHANAGFLTSPDQTNRLAAARARAAAARGHAQ